MFDLAAARRVRLLGLDVDGVLTDNGVYLGALDGRTVELKRFDIQDGLGLSLLREAGIAVAWVTGRASEATAVRARELGVTDLIQVAAHEKVPAIEALLAAHGIGWEALAFVGDDLADLPVFARAGLPIAVANARDEVRAAARGVTVMPGGRGAVREVIERLLRSRGEYDAVLGRWLARAGMPA